MSACVRIGAFLFALIFLSACEVSSGGKANPEDVLVGHANGKAKVHASNQDQVVARVGAGQSSSVYPPVVFDLPAPEWVAYANDLPEELLKVCVVLITSLQCFTMDEFQGNGRVVEFDFLIAGQRIDVKYIRNPPDANGNAIYSTINDGKINKLIVFPEPKFKEEDDDFIYSYIARRTNDGSHVTLRMPKSRVAYQRAVVRQAQIRAMNAFNQALRENNIAMYRRLGL